MTDIMLQTLTVSAGETSSGITARGSTINVQSGGTVINTSLVRQITPPFSLNHYVSSFENVLGTAIGTTVSFGCIETVSSGGTTSGTTVTGGGFQYVSSGGTANGTVVSSGAVDLVFGGGTAIGTTVASGGTLELASGAQLGGATTISSGGFLQFDSGYALSGYAPTDGVTIKLGANVAALTLPGVAAINGIGNSLDNVITGNSAANTLDGAGGNDTLMGGDGNDIYYVDSTADQVIETPTGGGWDNIYTSVDNHVLPANVESLLLLNGVVHGTGNADGNVIYGNDGANVLDGAGGADVLFGGNGNDTFYVHDITNQVTETATGGAWDTIYTDVENFVLPANVEALVLTNSVVAGRGNSAPNAIYGNDAENIIDGGGGGDALLGGNGNDTYYVRATSDQVTETATGGVWDTVNAYVDYTLPANVEAMVLDLNTLHGTGNSGANAFYVASAYDTLTGGGGNDTFFFHAGFGNASITDFNSAEGDIIDLHNTFSSFGQLQANTQQVGANTVITWTGQDVLTLQNVAASSLTAGDFHLS